MGQYIGILFSADIHYYAAQPSDSAFTCMSFGDTLRAARERRRLSLDAAASVTKISSRYLLALEAEELDRIPAGVYQQGFLRAYAIFLELDPAPLLADLKAITASPTQEVITPERSRLRSLFKLPTR
jgi:cytoskeletal protein RodZ